MMFENMVSVAPPFLGAAVNMLVLVIISRFLKQLGFFYLYLISVSVGLVFIIYMNQAFFDYTEKGKLLDYLACSFFIYFFLVFILFNIINASIGSLRIRILLEIQRSSIDESGLTYMELLKIYSLNELVSIRIDRLVYGNQIQVIKNKLFLKGFFLKVISILFMSLKKIVFGDAR
jgi:hypothetical protein